jgi:hypothetical protein
MNGYPAMSISSGPNSTSLVIEGPSDFYNSTNHGGLDVTTTFGYVYRSSSVWTSYLNGVIYLCCRADGTGGVILQENTTSWAALSDEYHKEHIENIENASEFLKNVRTIKYAMKEYSLDSANAVGFMAQDFVNDYPEIVATFTNEDGTKKLGLRYTEVIPIAVAAIKEKQSTMQSQATQISSLQTTYETLASTIMGLKTRF